WYDSKEYYFHSMEAGESTISAADHLPGLTIAELFKRLSSQIGLVIDVDHANSSITFNWNTKQITSAKRKDRSGKFNSIRESRISDSRGMTLAVEMDQRGFTGANESRRDEVVIGLGERDESMKGGSLTMVRDSIPRLQEWAADPEDNEWKDG